MNVAQNHPQEDQPLRPLGSSERNRWMVSETRADLVRDLAPPRPIAVQAQGKLITLDKKVKAHKGKLKLSNIRPEIYEVFAITKLNKLFDIKDDEADALAVF